ncbi:hypothetical protein D3C71_2123780 [compost metagenome]
MRLHPAYQIRHIAHPLAYDLVALPLPFLQKIGLNVYVDAIERGPFAHGLSIVFQPSDKGVDLPSIFG